jgi:hypothetical protein
MAQVCRKLRVTEQTYDRWRKDYGGVRTDQVKRLKELEKENARLEKVVADLTLDNAILKEAAYPSRRAGTEPAPQTRSGQRCSAKAGRLGEADLSGIGSAAIDATTPMTEGVWCAPDLGQRCTPCLSLFDTVQPRFSGRPAPSR